MMTMTPAWTSVKGVPGVPTGVWVGINLLRLTAYLAVVSMVSTALPTITGFVSDTSRSNVLEVLADTALMSGYMFVLGGIGCLPGLAIWLVVLDRLRRRPRPRARVVAIATAPIVGVVWLVLFLAYGMTGFALIFGLFWPLGAGLVVRLDPPAARMPT